MKTYRDYNYIGQVTDFPEGTILRRFINGFEGFIVVSPGRNKKADNDELFGLDMAMNVSYNIYNDVNIKYQKAPVSVQIAFLSILQNFQYEHPEAKLTFDCKYNLIKNNMRKFDKEDKKLLSMNRVIYWGNENYTNTEITVKNIKFAGKHIYKKIEVI